MDISNGLNTSNMETPKSLDDAVARLKEIMYKQPQDVAKIAAAKELVASEIPPAALVETAVRILHFDGV